MVFNRNGEIFVGTFQNKMNIDHFNECLALKLVNNMSTSIMLNQRKKKRNFKK